MKKAIKLIVILVIILLCICIARGLYATDSEKIIVTNWTTLKNVIENSGISEIEIHLSDEESNTWTADSKITILSQQKITLIAESSITIKRGNDFVESLIENNGSLDMMTSSNEINIVLDGNKENVQATGSLITINGGDLNISNITLQNNNKNGNGGAILASKAELEISNVILSENEARGGGAICISSEPSNTNLNNVRVINNKATTYSGGGIYAYGNLVISGENTLISGNIAETYGGGLMVKTNGILNGGDISNNRAITYAGGGIRVDGKFTYNSGTIKENTAGTKGGGIDFSNGILYGEGIDVFNNTAVEGGNDLYPDLENNVDWTKDENLKLRAINVSLLKSYVRGTDIVNRGTQGMTVTDKYIVFALHKSDNDTTMIAIADKNTGEILNIVDGFEFKHANDMTYDSKNGDIYILTTSMKIAKFKINEQYQITDLQYVDCNRIYWGIAYNKDNDGFICLGGGKKMYVTNNKFEEQSMFETPSNLTTQGMGYYNGNIYFCCTESGSTNQYQTIYNNKEKSSNLIYKYNLKGDLVETLYIPNTTLYGEIESCAFEEDGTLVASYNITLNGKSTVSLYKSDITAPILEVCYNTSDMTNKDVIVTINSNEEIQENSEWVLLTDKKSLTKTYSNNTQEDVIVEDLFGNTSTAKISITNIDKQKPIAQVKYSKAEQNLDGVIVTIEANEKLQGVEGWTLSSNKKTLSKTYTQYSEETITIYDLAGNSANVLIEPKKLNRIELTTKPTKINYIQNYENLDLTGGVLTATYNDNSTDTISLTNENVKVTGFDNSKVGKNTITVEYQGKTVTFDVTIEAKKLTEIEVTTQPTKTEYIEGENFDEGGMKIVAIYNDNTSKEITDYVITDGNNMLVGKTSVTISYTEGNITRTLEQQIKVLAKLKIDFEDYNELNETEKNYIENVGTKTTLGEFTNKVKTNGEVQIFKDNTKITNNQAKVSTGMKLKISLNNETFEYTIVVKGDCNGDGECDLKDLLQVNKHRLNKTQLKDEYLLAGDVNNDNTVNIKDILQMNKFRLGKIQSL